MARKQIEVFDYDYDILLLRAGEPHKIAFVVQNLIRLSNACKDDITKMRAWREASQGTLPLDKT